METALSTISNLPSTKDEFYRFKTMLKTELLNGAGEKELIALTIAMRSIEETLKDPDVERHFVDILSRYSSKEVVKINGATLVLQETGVKYDYAATGDPKWTDLDKQITELTERRKQREKLLQAIPHDSGLVDDETGLYINRPPKSSKTKVVVKL
jgi:hypothetical protein